MNNVISITFNSDVPAGNFLSVTFREIAVPSSYYEKGEFFQYTPRYSAGTIQIYDPGSTDPSPYTSTPGEYTAEQYTTYFTLDHTANGLLSIQRTINTIVISLPIEYEFFGVLDGGMQLNGDISVNLSTNAGVFNLLNETTVANTVGVCSFARHDFNFDTPVVEAYVNNILISGATGLNINHPFSRGIPQSWRFVDAFSNEINHPTSGNTGVYSLSEDNIIISIVPNTAGSTVGFSYDLIPQIGFIDPVFQWSLDGVIYQSSNLFTGQPDGTYTVYMKDQFDCVKSKNYTIQNNIIRTAYQHVSQANSIEYVLQETVDNINTFTNQDNQFSYQNLNRLNYCENTLFTTSDNTPTQVKSNYDTIEVLLRSETGPDITIATTQQSQNLNRFQSLDGMMYNYGDGKSGLYFDTGNIYNELDAVIGTYTLNGNIPTLGSTGNVIEVVGFGFFVIEDVLYDENVQKNVLVIQNNFVSLPTSVVVKSTFDLLNFEVIQFNIDWSSYGVGLYDVLIKFSDAIYDDVCYVSENIEIALEHPNTLALHYFNDNNRDIFYKYGIQHFIRVPYLQTQLGVQDEIENNVGDFTTQLVESSIHKNDKYFFEALPSRKRIKLIIALSSKHLFINGIGYIKNSPVELDPIENTNLAYVNQILIRTNINYNINNQNQVPSDGPITFDIPEFLNTGSQFITV